MWNEEDKLRMGTTSEKPVKSLNSVHRVDTNGNPCGGETTGCGVSICWQNGPLGRGDDRKEPNGASVCDLIGVVMDRLMFFQTASDGKMKCDEDKDAILFLASAKARLNDRTARREAEGVEGTNKK